MMVAIAGPVVDKLHAIAEREGLTVEQLAIDACGLLVESYNAMKRGGRRDGTPAMHEVRQDVAAVSNRSAVTDTIDATGASAGILAAPPSAPAPGPVVAKRRPGRPRKVRPDPDARCAVCDHTRAEHCGEKDKCLSARCVCATFRGNRLAEL